MVEKGKVISVEYTGKLENGEVFDSSEGRDPLKFQVGSGQVIPMFESSIIGKEVGDVVDVNIKCEDAFGERRDDLIISVDKNQVPKEVEVGQTLSAKSENNQEVNVLVKEVNEDKVIVDGNHQLAGENLEFKVKVVSIEEPKSE